MADRQRLEAQFLECLPVVDRATGALSRRHGLREADAEDFASWVKLKLVENDYATLAKFRGESSISTYLTVVIAMLFRDYRVTRWGRWRPSAAARRCGNVAVRLEALVYRQGYPVRQAAEILRTSSDDTLSDGAVAKLLSRLPAREPLRPVPVGAEALEVIPAANTPEDVLVGAAADERRAYMEEAMARAIERLDQEDRLMIRLRFWENLSVADIARALGTAQKPLYRRLERALAWLRRDLENEGLSAEEVQVLVEEVST